MAEWSRSVNTTLQKYVKGSTDNIMRNRKFLGMLQMKAMVKYKVSGLLLNWKVRYKRAPVSGYADGDTISFPRTDRWKEAKLEWRGYNVPDMMTKREMLMNQGPEQIINVYSELGKSLVDDLEENFGDEVYIDGNASGNSKRIHGAESFYGVSGLSTITPVGLPSDTYAGLRTDLGYYSGNWSKGAGNLSEWPAGKGDPNYDFWAPLVIDYNSAKFVGDSSAHTWKSQCKTALRYLVVKSRKNKTRKGMMDLVMLNDDLWRVFADAWDGSQRILRDTSTVGITKLGFTDVINFEGVDVTSEYGLPVGIGYGFNFDQIELNSQQSELFVVDGPDWDIATKSWRTTVDFLGNMKWNPRYQGKLYAGSSET